MKRRSRAGSELTKGRRRKAPKPERRDAPKAASLPNSFSAVEETKFVQLTRELSEALEREAATSEVLQVISGSPGDLQPVFQAMLKNAARLCDASFGSLYRWDGDALHLIATYNTPPAFAEYRKHTPLRPGPTSASGRMVATKTAVHVADVTAERAYIERDDPSYVAAVELGGSRTIMAVPMLKEDELIGAFLVSRREVRPFTDKQIALVTSFAAQAVIAIENVRLLNELRQRTTDLTERTTDLSEALEQQTATSDVLKVISGSPGDLQPVFDTMLANATRLCEATHGHVWTFDGEQMYAVAVRGDAPFVKWLQDHNPVRPIPGSAAERIVRGERFVHVADRRQEPAYRDNETFRGLVDTSGIRASLSVSLRKGETLLGMINVYRQDVRPFTDNQIKLVEDFASQAVIAIENARLLNELKQSLEQQTATADVLKVISRSTFDLQTVLDTLAMSAAKLCAADKGAIWQRGGEFLRLTASYRVSPDAIQYLAEHPLRADQSTVTGRALVEGRAIHVADVASDPDYSASGFRSVGGYRSILGVPLLRGREIIGVFGLTRDEVHPFADKQIDLVTTFADQAVIAIENARLLKELRQRTEEVIELNQQLEHRVTDQVDEIERMSRLRRFLPPQVADLIVASGTEKQLESHRREITALFCDLRGFTGFTESADAEDVMALLRDYHAAIGEIIIKYNGTLERYAGDGVMVVFNDPVPVENPALQAVLMALELRDALGALTATWSRLGHEIGFGIGIAHGFATLGTIGFEGRFDYAAIGTVSNVASRLCDEAKPGQILISPRVLMKVENAVKVEPVGEFELKGIRRPLAAYNVVGAISEGV
jgi:GAF domain-containing protein